MNRRGFIGQALAGLAAIPLLGKIVTSQPYYSGSISISGVHVWDRALSAQEQIDGCKKHPCNLHDVAASEFYPMKRGSVKQGVKCATTIKSK